MLTPCNRPGRGLQNRRGGRAAAVAIEFAFIAPIMLTMVVGTFDAVRLLLTWRRMTAAASAMVEMGTSLAAQTNSTNVLEDYNVAIVNTVPFAYFPEWKTVASSGYGISLSSVKFTPTSESCTTDCTYLGTVLWSASGSHGSPQRRPCTPMTKTTTNAPPSLTTLPDALYQSYGKGYGPLPILVADLTYQFKPVLIGSYTGAINLETAAYLVLRVGGSTQAATYSSTGVIPAAGGSTETGYVQCPAS